MLKKFSILTLALFAFSCKKSDSAVGVDVLPTSDQLGSAYAEIIPSISFTKTEDSVMTTNISNSNLLGSINDPVFGRFDASMYIDFEVQGLATSLGTNPVLDSAVLKLNYNTAAYIPFLGDTTDPLSIDIFPLTQKLYRDSLYYSTRNISYNTSYSLIEGGSKTITPRPYSNITISKDDQTPYPPQLRIRLKKEFGEQIFNPTYLTSAGAFQNAFYGMFITANRSVMPQPSYGSVFYVNAIDSRILLYYHNDEATGPLLPLEILCGANSTRFGHFDHDYQFLAEQSLAQQVGPPHDTSATGPGKDHLYIQGASGLRSMVDLSALMTWRDSNVVINKAELSFAVDNSKPDYNNPSKYPLPIKLYLETQDPVTGLPTSLFENVYAFGGNYDPNTNRYTFNIPHTVAQIIGSKKDYTKFYVSVYQTGLFPQRVVLGGWGSTNAPVKLKLWYTRLQFPKK